MYKLLSHMYKSIHRNTLHFKAVLKSYIEMIEHFPFIQRIVAHIKN